MEPVKCLNELVESFAEVINNLTNKEEMIKSMNDYQHSYINLCKSMNDSITVHVRLINRYIYIYIYTYVIHMYIYIYMNI